jgi:PAS domain S-box-containing protein
MNKKIHILLIEDNESDQRLVELYLKEAFPGNYMLVTTDRVLKAVEFLSSGKFDVILSDLALPDSYGMDTFNKVFKASHNTPVIVLTGYGDETFGINAVQQGAADFLNKNQLDANLLRRAIVYSIERNNLQLELKEHVKQIEESEKKYRSLFEDSKDPIYVSTPEGKMLDFNKATLDLFGYTREELQKLNLTEVYDKPAEREKLKRDIERFGSIQDYEVTLKKKSGSKILAQITAYIRKDENGNTSYHGILRDVTAYRKIQELKRDKEVAEKAALARQEFLSIMSHEIRTPLNAVLGITHLLLEENPLPHQQENLKLLNYSANNLLTLLNNILDYSKVESGKLQMERINFDFPQLINHVVASFRHNAEEKGLKLYINSDSSIPQHLIGDPFRLTQVLNNLLHNALKFTRRGSITLRVELLSQDNREVELGFEVSDTGIGIESKLLGEIFDSFAQARLSITREYGGTGLGLYICKQLVNLMGGEITAKSQIGKGTTFSFDLQFAIGTEKMTAALESHDGMHTPLHAKKVLLVEDNDTNRMLANKFITRWGADIDTAVNGHEAVEKVKQGGYDIVLMDLQMPVMDGYEATQKIRTLGFTKEKLPIVALSAYTSEEDRKHVLASGMNDFIPKPIDLKELYRKLMINLGLVPGDKEEMPEAPVEEGILSLEELLETFPDNEFRLQYLDLLRRDFNDLPLKISEALKKNDPKLLSVHIHKISPAFERLNEKTLPEKLSLLKGLLSREKKDDDAISALYAEVKNICSRLSDRIFETKRRFVQQEAEAQE